MNYSLTKEQSIDYLKDLWNEVYNEDSDGYDYAKAIDMAIESLQKDIERHEMVIRASERHLGIVRCKDCKHGQYDATHYFCAEHGHKVYEDDFCSRGERISNRGEEVNGFKSVGQAWNTSQGRWEP